MIVAIDGPAGAGKSTIARMIAARRGWTYLDTGAMYRTVTLLALEQGMDPGAADELGQLSNNIEMSFQPGPDGLPRVFAGCREVTEEIRSPGVTAAVSEVSAHASVREAMVEMQRAMTAVGDVVVDGRDIGTVVCPNAEVKIFLTASNSERARRRRLELEAKGIDVPQEKMEQDISARDEYDSSRKVSPLKAADDAVNLDTTDLGIDKVVDRVSDIIDAKSS
ncbi:MAG: (d)CMP kinase [Thermoleophilia bacterium]